MDCLLRGDISITDNIDIIKDIVFGPPNMVKVVALEELMTLPEESPNVIYGGLLLPSIEAMMAAADGDEALFDEIYNNDFNRQDVSEVISVIITYLYKGGSIVLYFPEDDMDIKRKVIEILWKRYGIMIGIIGERPVGYDSSCIPIWLSMMYSIDTITTQEFLTLYPVNVPINEALVDKAIYLLRIYGNRYQEQVESIQRLISRYKANPNLIIPFKKL